jgi:hypothetical protein
MHSILTRAVSALLVFIALVAMSQEVVAQMDLVSLDLSNAKTYLLKTTDGKRYAGRVDQYDRTGLVMTRRNGRIVILEPHEILSINKVADNFYPKSFEQIRDELQREFGSKYVVSATNHFLVVHPPGDYKKWALPIEQLFVRFCAYFSTRGCSVSKPEFPMVAVILRTKNEFARVTRGRNMQPNVVGYYAFHSNRLFAYQQNLSWRSRSQNWSDTMNTVIHEVTHQVASNTGIHSRLAVNPRWVTEGLGTMFEADGVNNYFKYPDFHSRINWDRLRELRRLYDEGKVRGTVNELVIGDGLFNKDPARAYAVSWALTLYLAERNPHRYAQYLESLQRDEFTSSLNASNRMKYFYNAFGEVVGVEAALKRFVDQMPKSPGK